MKDLRHDLTLAFRLLWKRPAFTTLTIFILALGIGANAAIFSVINGLLLRPLPYPDSERLVQVWNKYPLMDLPQASVSVPDYLDRRQGVEAFEESCLYYFNSFNISVEERPERVVGVLATASLFPTLQAQAYLGQVFNEEQDELGSDGVTVLSHDLWKRAFGGDESIIGRDIRLNGEPHRVLGVMPPEFQFPHPQVELWKPFAFTEEQKRDDSRGREFAQLLARLAPGASVEQAQAQIDAIHAANRERFPQAREFWVNSGFGGSVLPYREELFGELRPTLWMLQAMVALVLLIVCANVANLLLTRVSGRRREIAVRSALGANRWHLARQLLAESLVLSLLGGLGGILVALGGVRLLNWLEVDRAARGIFIGIDANVLLFALLLALATGVLFGLFPIATTWRTDPGEVVNEAGRGSAGSLRGSLQRKLLVVSEMALAVVLLAGAGLLGKSFLHLLDENPGFNPEGILLAEVSLPTSSYPEGPAQTAFFEQALEAIRTLPGVKSAGVVSNAPFSGSSSSGSYSIDGYEPGPGESDPHAFIRLVDEQYFQTLEIPLIQGRTFQPADRAEAPTVVVVDRRMVEKYWPGENPIGKRLRRGGPDSPALTVVGVVDPVKITTLDRPVTKETIYASYRQMPRRNLTFVLRTQVNPETLTSGLREAVGRIDPELPVYDVLTMEEQLRGSLRTQRVSLTLVSLFAALAVILAAVGIYGVLGFAVAQRTRELGTRMALGADTSRILRLVMGQGLGLALAGVVAGLAAGLLLGLALSRFLSPLLFQVDPWDPLVFGAVSLGLILIALLACFAPARRATRIDPCEALRYE